METIKKEKKAELKERIKDIERRVWMMSDEYFDYAIKEIEFLQREIEQIDKMSEEEIKEEYNSKSMLHLSNTLNSSFPEF